MLIDPGLSLEPEAQYRFEKIMQQIDFSNCSNSYQACRLIFKRVDNAATSLAKRLNESNKKLEEQDKELAKLREELQNALSKKARKPTLYLAESEGSSIDKGTT